MHEGSAEFQSMHSDIQTKRSNSHAMHTRSVETDSKA